MSDLAEQNHGYLPEEKSPLQKAVPTGAEKDFPAAGRDGLPGGVLESQGDNQLWGKLS